MPGGRETRGPKGVNELIFPNHEQIWAKIAGAPEVTRSLSIKSREYVTAICPRKVASPTPGKHLGRGWSGRGAGSAKEDGAGFRGYEAQQAGAQQAAAAGFGASSATGGSQPQAALSFASLSAVSDPSP